jgi:hypothetical protein
MLLEAWRAFEAEAESHGEAQRAAAIAAVEKRMPKRVKRKVRPMLTTTTLCTVTQTSTTRWLSKLEDAHERSTMHGRSGHDGFPLLLCSGRSSQRMGRRQAWRSTSTTSSQTKQLPRPTSSFWKLHSAGSGRRLCRTGMAPDRDRRITALLLSWSSIAVFSLQQHC